MNLIFGTDGIRGRVGHDIDEIKVLSLGIASSKYGIEETLGGQNTTLFQQGDQIYDGNATPLVATIQSAGALGDGDSHQSLASLTVTLTTGTTFTATEQVEGLTTGLTATSNAAPVAEGADYIISVKDIVSNDPNFKFNKGELLRGNGSGAQATIKAVEYTTYLRNEED